MNIRVRKLIGTAAVVAFLVVYCLVAMALGAMVVASRGGAAQFAYFVAAGFAWLPPVMLLIRWMLRT
jgi:hypothetical protein